MSINTNPNTLLGALGAVLHGVGAGQYRALAEAGARLEAARGTLSECREEYAALFHLIRDAVAEVEGDSIP